MYYIQGWADIIDFFTSKKYSRSVVNAVDDRLIRRSLAIFINTHVCLCTVKKLPDLFLLKPNTGNAECTFHVLHDVNSLTSVTCAPVLEPHRAT